MISLKYHGKIYNIQSEPFETIEDSYRRAWYIVKAIEERNKENQEINDISAIYSSSIMMINKNKGMVY